MTVSKEVRLSKNLPIYPNLGATSHFTVLVCTAVNDERAVRCAVTYTYGVVYVESNAENISYP